MSVVWIEAARQQVRVVSNHGDVLGKVDHQGWSTFRFKEYGSAADNARAAERCRLATICRGSKLDSKRDTNCLKRVAALQAELAKLFQGKCRRT
jgi:hypothetical protein